MRLKQTTSTTLVEEALRRADDFCTMRQLVLATGRNSNQVSAALYMLRKYRAAECMDVEGTLWWYLTPDSDQRTYTIAEKTEETKPRKPRKRKAK